MPDHSSDAAPAATRAQLRAARAPAEQPATGDDGEAADSADWRLGGPTVDRWREWLLAGALLSLGIGILAGTLIQWLWQSPWAAASASALLWASMLVPVIWALSLSRPAGLLRFRALDLLYGLVLGGLLRVAQGWIEQATTGATSFPSYPLVDGRLSDGWWFTDLVAVVAIAPVVEELFFGALIVVAVYTVLRRPLGGVAAGALAVIVSSAMFVMVHSVTLGLSVDQLLATTLLGVVCAMLVMLTGRIWGAVLVHVTYNATFVVLALAGSYAV